MRAEKELDVDVSIHSQRAAERTNGNSGRLSSPLHIPKPSTFQSDTVWLRLERRFPSLARALPSNWERVTVNKQIDSYTMPKWIANAILIAILGFGVQSWWARSADHDTMVRIETQLKDAKDAEKEAKDEQRRLNGDMQAWREVMNGNQKQIIGMLSQSQADSLDKPKKSNN